MRNAATGMAAPLSDVAAFAHALPRAAPAGGADPSAFRSGMRALAGAVTVLATVQEGRRWGLTATAVCSLSAEPPRLLACVNQRGASFAALQASRAFAVNVLADDQFAIAERFAGRDANAGDRFSSGAWHEGVLGLPVIAGAVGAFECRVAEIIDAGTHAILIGDVVAVRTSDDARPLLYCDGRFASLAQELIDPRYGYQF
jgi:flavin reductase (DIM6/NTAB) family NADH-FMN oxidoreductase RutF